MQQSVARSRPTQVLKSCDIREKHLRQIDEPTGRGPASDAGHRPNGEVGLIAGIRQRRAGAKKPDKQGREEEHPLPGVAICDAACPALNAIELARLVRAMNIAVLAHTLVLLVRPLTRDAGPRTPVTVGQGQRSNTHHFGSNYEQLLCTKMSPSAS